MNCLQAEEYFSAHLEDTLDYQMLQDFEGHLAACETCQYEYARFQESVKAVQQLPQIEPSPHFMAALQQRLDAEQRETDSVKETVKISWKQLLDIFRRPQWAFSGAIVLILAAAGIYFSQYASFFDQDSRPAQVTPISQTEQVTPSPERLRIELPRFVRDNSQLIPNGAILTPAQPMQQHYMLKQVSYTTTSTSGGL